jgi:caspase domain-containing protein/CARDB protein/parallel beta helix pectate lyase-like protein
MSCPDRIVAAGVTLTIEPGAVVKFHAGRGITVRDGGTLDAPATETDPIVITMLTDDSIAGDTNRDGSASRPYPGQSKGIKVLGAGQFNSTPFVELRYIVVNHAGTIAADQVWSGSQVHRVVGNLVVPDGVTLTIEPGAIVKMNDDLTITVEAGGQLLAEGTVGEPITVTSIHDDTIGGDTTGNGSATTPGPGNWLGIYADGGHAELDHVRVYYAGGSLGGYDMSAAVRNLSGGTLNVNACLVQDAFFDGFRTQGGLVTITNTIIVDADRAISAAGSNLEVVNCTLDGNRIGVQIHGSPATIANTIISNSLEYGIDWDMGATAPTVRYSNVWGSGTADFHNHFGEPDPVPGTDGIISGDPLYVDRAAGIYELGAGSPALDAADSFVSPAQDMEGRPRYNDTSAVDTGIGPLSYVDIGALERWHVQTDVDLVVTNLQAALLPNNQIQLDVTIANQGNGDAPGGWLQRFMLQQYSARESQRAPAPTEIGEATQLVPLAAGATTQVRVVLPMPTVPSGDYQASVTVDSTNQIIEQLPQGDFNNGYVGSAVVTVDNPDLVVGTTTAGDWNSDGSDRAFDVTVAPGQRVQIQFSSPQTPADVYYSSGAMPSPMEFEQHAQAGGAIVVANPGDQSVVGIVRIRGQEAAGGASPYSITTSAMTNGLQTVAPTSAGNSGPVTVMIEGGIFDTNTTFALRPTGSAGAPQIDASKVKIFDGQTTAAATFDLTSAATGSYDVWASWNGTAAQLPSAFDVFDGGAGLFTIELVGPDVVRPDRQLPYRLVWRNQGTNDIPVQYVTVDTPAGVHIAQHPDGKERMDHIELLTFTATTSDYATLPPGSSGELDLWLTFDQGELFYDLDMDWLPIDDPDLATTPIDWEAILNDVEPPNADQQLWDDVIVDVGNELGENWGQVLDELVDKAVIDTVSEGLTNVQSAADAIAAGASLVGKQIAIEVGVAMNRLPVVPGGDGIHRDWVLIVAIEDYNNAWGQRKWDLPGAIQDANNLEQFFRNDLYIPNNQITVLRDRATRTDDTIGTANQITQAWRQIVAQADGDDKIKFFFIGHGSRNGRLNLNGNNIDPTGNTITGTQLRQMIKDFPMPGEMYFMFDACFSASAGAQLAGVPRLRWDSAVDVTEVAIEPDWRFESFTDDWLDATRDRDNDTDKDGRVTLEEAFRAVVNTNKVGNALAGVNPQTGGGPDAPDQELHDDIGDAMRKLKTDKSLSRFERIKLIRLINSVDPNEKTGPDGHGEENYITATDIPYTVYFENDPEQANAAAQVVTITDQLDPNLDWSTFELGEVVFGNTSVLLDGTPTHGVKQVDVPELGVVVDIEAQLDMQTGFATWTITTLDPLTLEPTQDPLAGFLPPNTEPPIGEGHVSFTIQRLASLGTGDSFSNQASIIFDTNDPIVTDPVLNTTDVGAPISQVDALPAESSPEFTVSWGGSDDAGGSGIAHYDVYVAVDRGTWELWKEATTETSADYTGMLWHTYAFYSVTTDNVGHTELPPQDADATTDVVPLELGTVDFTQLLDLSPADSEIWYQMQPARTGQMTVIWPATTGTATVTLFDALLTEPPVAAASGATGRLDGSVQIGEIYFIRVTGDSADVDLMLANLVTTTGTEIQVFGTAAADAFEFAPTGSYAVTIKGIPYHFDDTQYETIVFTGGLGDDTATLTGAPSDEIARFHPDHGTFGENGFLVTVNDVTAITAHGGGGTDSAFLYDSPGDDEFVAREDYGKLSGDAFVLETFDFMFNYGYATTQDGGADVAYMEDTARKDKFKFDWPNGGQFFGKMYGGGLYYNRAKNFEQIIVTMSDGTDRVRLFDSEGDDTFHGQKGESRLVGSGFDVTVTGYDHLIAYASTGLDVAHLEDSEDDDTARARPHKTTLWGGEYTDPTYAIIARRFDEYHLVGKHGGFDRAKLHDTAFSDHVHADDDSATFYKNDGDLELLYEAVAFEWVRLYAAEGGSQNTIQKKDPVNFDLVYDPAMWDEIP